jgi:hypothetical protein
MDETKFKDHIKELLELSDILIKNEYLYKEIIKYFKSIDFLYDAKNYYLEFSFCKDFDYKNALNLLLDIPKGAKKHQIKYRKDILIPEDLLINIRKASIHILDIINDFSTNIFEYFVKKSKLENTLTQDSIIDINVESIGIYSLLKVENYLKISLTQYWAVLEYSKETKSKTITEYSSTVKYSIGYTLDTMDEDILRNLPTPIIKYMYTFYPDLLL